MPRPRTPTHFWTRSGREMACVCRFVTLLALVCALSACGGGGGSNSDDEEPPDTEGQLRPVRADLLDPSEVTSGGGNTVALSNTKAFSKSNPQLGFIDEGKFKAGDFEFRGTHDGLGPLFNNPTCQGCHKEDGRGNPPDDLDGNGETDQPMVSMLVRLSIPGADVTGRLGVKPEPTYGDQIQVFGALETSLGTPVDALPVHQQALSGLPEDAVGEAFVSIRYEPCENPFAIRFDDGTSYDTSDDLLCPTYLIRDLAYGPFDDNVQFSPRVASQVVGMGLLEVIPEKDIRSYEDPEDLNKNGISGRPNWAWDATTKSVRMGRFGHKASKPSLLHQLTAAYLGDIGITSSLFPEENCTALQDACKARAEDEVSIHPEVDLEDLILALVEFYVRQLAVPQRRGWSTATQDWAPEIWRGRRLFFEAGCADCHVPRHVTGDAVGSVLGEIAGTLTHLLEPPESGPLPQMPSLSNQVIWPFTDLLLHDMGGSCTVTRERDDGSSCADEAAASCLWVQRCDGLADSRSDFEATGSEWRTPPLWGLGLAQVVNESAGFLHDGRARTIEEAILWHGHEDSEARGAWESFVGLNRSQKNDLLAFLESL